MTVTLSTPVRETHTTFLNTQELFLLGFVAVIGAAAFGLSELWDRNVAWLSFVLPITTSLGLLVFGVFVRAHRNMPRLALLMIGVALYFAFGSLLAVMINTFFPVFNPIIDDQLTAMDAALGHDWISFLTLLADYPLLGKALKWVYISSLGQLLIVFACLAFLNRAQAMYHFILTGTLGLLITALIWALYPSFGPSAYQPVPPEVASAINLFINNDYGALLMSYATNGIPEINPDAIKATIAFPSFHIVMACLVVWFMRGTPFFWAFAILNTFMLPATVAHGAHHLVDLFGGVVVFVIAMWIAGRVLALISHAQEDTYPL